MPTLFQTTVVLLLLSTAASATFAAALAFVRYERNRDPMAASPFIAALADAVTRLEAAVGPAKQLESDLSAARGQAAEDAAAADALRARLDAVTTALSPSPAQPPAAPPAEPAPAAPPA